MIRTIKLHGALGKKFGRSFRFDVSSPAEAIRALCEMVPGFQAYISERYYQVFRGRPKDKKDMDAQELRLHFSETDMELNIFPRAIGAKKNGLGKILLGALLVVAAFAMPASWAILGESVAGLVGRMGVAMAIGGISQAISPQNGSDYDNREQPKSSLFGGLANTSVPGAAVPVIVGICEVGSVVVSGAMHVEDRVVAEVPV